MVHRIMNKFSNKPFSVFMKKKYRDSLCRVYYLVLFLPAGEGVKYFDPQKASLGFKPHKHC